MGGHEVDRFRRHQFGWDAQVALILTVLVVDDDDEQTRLESCDRDLDR